MFKFLFKKNKNVVADQSKRLPLEDIGDQHRKARSRKIVDCNKILEFYYVSKSWKQDYDDKGEYECVLNGFTVGTATIYFGYTLKGKISLGNNGFDNIRISGQNWKGLSRVYRSKAKIMNQLSSNCSLEDFVSFKAWCKTHGYKFTPAAQYHIDNQIGISDELWIAKPKIYDYLPQSSDPTFNWTC